MTAPLFSVVIPLEYHRGQWERCWLAWRAQTLPKTQYESILVVPRDFPERDKLSALLGPNDRLEYSTERHDIGLCAIGAARARGRFLFFTESHCWPEPDVLERCLRAFTMHPEWAAFSCRSMRIAPNRLAQAEADMYEADIEHGMTRHPWRKILDQCFVTRREVYDKCGGLEREFGHFAEWVLAAGYFERGHLIGYLPEARLYHYYTGQLAELRKFTRDFTSGEMRYFATETHKAGERLLDVPPQWICQGSWDRRLAQSLLRIAARDMLARSAAHPRLPQMFARTVVRWLTPAIAGEGAARVAAAVEVFRTFVSTKLASLVGSKARLSRASRTYVAALIDHRRLECIEQGRRARDPQGDRATGWNVFAPENAGFYPIEMSRETRFRWSEPAAIMPAWMPQGRHRICIECLPVRSLMQGTQPRFYVNECLVSARDVSIGHDTIELALDLARSGHCTLAWTCLPFPAAGDRRWLGLPVKRVVWMRTNGGTHDGGQ